MKRLAQVSPFHSYLHVVRKEESREHAQGQEGKEELSVKCIKGQTKEQPSTYQALETQLVYKFS